MGCQTLGIYKFVGLSICLFRLSYLSIFIHLHPPSSTFIYLHPSSSIYHICSLLR